MSRTAQNRARTVAEIRARRAYVKPRRSKVPKSRYPMAIEREYAKALAELVDQAHATINREIVPMIPLWTAEGVAELARVDGMRTDASLGKRITTFINAVANRFLAAMRPTALEELADRFARRTTQWSKAETNRRVRAAVGVDVFAAEPNLVPLVQNFVAENVALIKTIPQRYFEQVEGVVLRGATSGTLPRETAKQLASQFEITERRAALIARDQVGKFYGSVNKARQQKLGLKTYTWRTRNDNRVRPEHEEREGKVYAWNPEDADEANGIEYLPPEEQPGNPILCRCDAEGRVDDLLDGL